MVIYNILDMKNNIKNKVMELYPNFPKKLLNAHPNLTSSELELCIFIKFNLSDIEIAKIMSRHKRTIETKRYRLRKKLGLEKTEKLNNYIIKI